VAAVPEGSTKLISVEHPTGEISVEMQIDDTGDQPKVKRAALLRTARRLFEGQVWIPASVWDGKASKLSHAAE
jgi:4-oxalomesaconate tautomerase